MSTITRGTQAAENRGREECDGRIRRALHARVSSMHNYFPRSARTAQAISGQTSGIHGADSRGGCDVRAYSAEVFGYAADPVFWTRNSPLTLARTTNLSGLKIM